MNDAIGRLARSVGLLAMAFTLAATTAPLGAAPATGPGKSAAKSGSGTPRATEVLARVKLGTYIEDITYVRNGPHAHHVAFVDGYTVRAYPATTSSDRAIKSLFDVRALGFAVAPRGIEWIESERLFAFLDIAQPAVLYLTDHKGAAQPPRTLRYLDGYEPEWVDGLAYIPPNAPMYPDHLVVVANGFDEDLGAYRPRYVIFRRDGQAVAQLPLPEVWISGPAIFGYSATYVAPGRLLVTIEAFAGLIDLAGQPSGPRVPIPGVGDGIAQLADGRIVISDGAKLLYHDAMLQRMPQDDRNAGTGAGLIYPASPMWDARSGQLAVTAYPETSAGDFADLGIWRLSPGLDQASRVVDLGTPPAYLRVRSAAFVADEDHYAVLLRRRSSTTVAEIALYDQAGTLAERLSLAAALAGTGTPGGIGQLADRREFAISLGTRPATLRIVDRSGAFVRDVDFAGAGVVAATLFTYLPPTGTRAARFLVADWTGTRAVITDADGNLVGEFDYRAELGVVEPSGLTAIGSGRWAGAFAIVDDGASELVLFRLNGMSP